MKKARTCFLILAMVLACAWMISAKVNATTVESGTCGDNLTWTMDDAGTLTISGTGAMSDYTQNEMPWYHLSVKNVVIESGVTTIGDYAFYNHDGLPAVTIPDSVTSIGDYAFCSCDRMITLVIGDNVTTVGDHAFGSCKGLTSVTLGNSVTTIGEYAFAGCESLKSVTIPACVTQIGKFAFQDSAVRVDGNNTAYSNDASGVLFNKDKTLLIQAPYSLSGSYTVPEGVTTIDKEAFNICTELTSVTIPDSVITVESRAFYYCKKLSSVIIGTGVTTIGEDAFSYCERLKHVYITDLAAWCEIAFADSHASPMNCQMLSFEKNLYLNGTLLTDLVIPEGVSVIGDYAFLNCNRITSVAIPDSVTAIGVSAFSSCTGFDSIDIPDSVTAIGDYAFYACDNLTAVVVPDSVTSIGAYAFSSCDSLQNATMGDGVTAIGDYAFSECAGLTSVTIGKNVASIGSYAFYKCTGLKFNVFNSLNYLGSDENPYHALIGYTRNDLGDCTVHENTKLIAGSAFYLCNGLTSVTMGDSVVTIGNSAFSYCSKLTAATIGNGVTNIGEKAFYASEKLTTVTIGDHVTVIGGYAFYDCDGLKSVVIPDSVTTVGEHAFDSCSNLTSVNIGKNVTTMGYCAFEACDRLTAVYITDIAAWCAIDFPYNANPLHYGKRLFVNNELLTDLVIPEGVTAIGGGAFSYCTNLTTVTIPASVTSIGSAAFSRSSKLTGISVHPDNPAYYSDHCGVLFNKEQTTLLQAPVTIGNYVVPMGVTEIAGSAFCGCTNLKAVMIPDSVTTIGNAAFYVGDLAQSHTLTRVYYAGTEDQWNAIAIGDSKGNLLGAQRHYNAKIADLSVESLPLKTQFFLGEPLDVTGLTLELTFQDGASNVFCGQFDIKRYSADTVGEKKLYVFVQDFFATITVEIVETITGTCGSNVIWELTPDGTLTISGNGTMSNFSYKKQPWFVRMDDIKRVVIKPGVTSIGDYAFYFCKNLISVDIPGTVTSIGERAFYNCDAMTAVTIPRGVTRIGERAFSGCDGITEVSVAGNAATIGVYAFSECDNLTAVMLGDGVATIGEYAFYKCGSLTTVAIPKSVRTISKNAFSECGALTDIYAADMNAWLKITWRNEYANPLFANELEKKLYFAGELATDIILPGNVTELKKYAFYRCASIQSVVIPAELTLIDNSAFAECTGLETVYYTGTEGQWEEMIIGGGNDPIKKANVVYEYSLPAPSGDLDGIEGVNEDDAIYLLQHVMMPDLFTVPQPVDFNGDGEVNEDDAIYLLQHVMMPELFPLN